jgi:tetratricopeptide (TPR) repeat protein
MKNILPLILFVFQLTIYAQEKPKKPVQLYEEADGLYGYGKYAEALTLLDECLKINPRFMDAYPLRASVREQLKDEEGALTDYSIYLEQYPENPEVLLSRAMLRYKIGFYQQAEEDFKKILSLPPQETNSIFFRQDMSVDARNPAMTTTNETHHAVIYNYLGLIAFKLNKPKTALDYFDTAIKLDPREPDFYVNRGLAKESLADSTAYTDYEVAIRLNPNHTLAHHNLEAAMAKGKVTSTKEERLTKTIEVDSTMLLPYLERALQRYESGFYKGALEDYNHALELSNGDSEIYFGRGLTREKLKDYEGAFSDYTKAIELQENFLKAWLSRGNVLLKLERYHDAIDDYTVALIYQSDYPHAYYNRGIAKLKLKKNEEACLDFKQAETLGMTVDGKVKSKACDHK